MALTVALLSTIVSPTVNECALLSRPPWLETSDVLRLQLQRRRPLDRGEHVAAEQRVVRAELHVHLADVLRLVLRSAAAVVNRAARVGGRRHVQKLELSTLRG